MQLSIGDLAELTSVKVATIRYYEQVGLIPSPTRTEGRQRRYGERTVDTLNFVREARALGFEVEHIRELLAVAYDPPAVGQELEAVLRSHLFRIDQRLAKLVSMRAELVRILEGGVEPTAFSKLVTAVTEGGAQPSE